MDETLTSESARRALVAHDIVTVYRLLIEAGVRRSDIARATGQKPSDVWEILTGRRTVMGYDMLERIAEGLGVPREWMGLAYSGDTGEDEARDPAEGDDDVRRRRLLGAAALALLGEVLIGEPGGLRLLAGSSSSALGPGDVPWINAMTDRLWCLDLANGGAAAHAAARGAAERVVGALRGGETDRELFSAASRLCRVAGWSAFDSGDRPSFWRCNATALELAREAGNTALVATVVSDAGRAEMMSGDHRTAAKLLELTATRQEPGAVMYGLLSAAYAPHSPESAKHALDKLSDAHGADTPAAVSMLGHVSLDLGDYSTAIEAYEQCIPHRFGREVVQETAPLAVAYLRSGETRLGVDHANKALAAATNVRSAQGTESMCRLSDVLRTQPDSTCQDLAVHIRQVCA